MIRLPRNPGEVGTTGEIRAGGTDLMDRRHLGRSTGEVVDLRDVPELDAIEEAEDGLRIGARVTIAALAADPRTPVGLAQAAGGLATPQIRAVATIAGNLRQHVRCWYYRNPQFTCLRAGGSTCHAREGDHLYHVCFDTQPCAAPHASTLGCALLAYDAVVDVHGRGPVPIATFLAETSAPGAPGALVTGVRVPRPATAPVPASPEAPAADAPKGGPSEERAAYFRAIARARAEWPLVEVVARIAIAGGVVSSARVVVGGVAPTPIRREAVEAALVGKAPTPDVLAAAAAKASEGAKPLPMTAYKVDLLGPTVLEALERAVGGA